MPLYIGSAYSSAPHLYHLSTGAANFTELTLPIDVIATFDRPCFMPYRRRLYIVGMFSPGIVVDEHKQVWRMGIHAPLAAPTVAASGTGLTGSYIPYLTFVHKDAEGKVIHESNLSAAGTTLALTNQGRSWTSLPTTSMDPRVTHKRGYVSVGGGIPRKVWERELGTVTTVTESVSDAFVANSTEAPVDANEDLTHGRGVPPAARFGTIWRDRAWYVGDPGDTVYFSELFEPESVALDPDNNFLYINTLRTKGGESITGIKGFEDALVLYCVGAEYAIVGYGPSSFEIRKISSSTTCLSHHGIVDAYGHHLYPTAAGIGARATPSDGAFRNLMSRTYEDQWAIDYSTNPRQFENSQAVFDKRSGNYILLTEAADAPKTFSYVVPYNQVVEQGATDPPILTDKQTRKCTSIGEYSAVGAKQPTVIYGTSDGFVMKQDVTDSDDAEDTLGKDLRILHKHFFFGDQGGDSNHGHRPVFIDLFVKSEAQDFTVNIYGGDDDAASGDPQFTRVVEASASAGATARTSHRVGIAGLSGKGFTIEILASSPLGFEYRGFTLEYIVGGQARNAT